MFEELFSLTFLIASGIVVLINSFILWLAVKIVGGRASFVNAIIFNILITILGFFINLFLPFRFLTQIIILIVWFFLITQFFKVSLIKSFHNSDLTQNNSLDSCLLGDSCVGCWTDSFTSFDVILWKLEV